MDPQLEKTPGLALPSPASEQGAGIVGSQEVIQPHTGQLPHGAIMPPTTPPTIKASVPLEPTQPLVAPVAMDSSTDDNTDALDEEWINKAKAVVEQTKHDPRLESTELSKVKADYLRIRYNKHIKVAEEQSK
jgi:hypothetical protein